MSPMPSHEKRAILVVVALLLVLTGIQLARKGAFTRVRPPEAAATQRVVEPQKAPAQASSPRPVKSGAPGPSQTRGNEPDVSEERANRGEVTMDFIAMGLMRIPPGAPESVTPEQAGRIKAIFDVVWAGFVRESFIRWKLEGILTQGQLAFIRSQAAKLMPSQFHKSIQEDKVVLDRIRALAGASPVESVAVPDNFDPDVVAPHFSFNPVFMASFDAMQKDGALAMQREQAARVLPYVVLYYENVPPVRPPVQIIRVLTKEQRAFIAGKMKDFVKERPEHTTVLKAFHAFIGKLSPQ